MKRFMFIAMGFALLLTMIPAVSLASNTLTGTVPYWFPGGDYGEDPWLGPGWFHAKCHWIVYLDKGGLVLKCLGSLPEGQTPPDTTVKIGSAEWGRQVYFRNYCGGPVRTDDWSTTIYPDGKVRFLGKWTCASPIPPYP